MTLDDLIKRGEMEEVDPDADAAAAAREEAAKHFASAKKIRDSDPHGAYQLAFDGARKAIVAKMREEGVRVRRGEGAHVLTGRYARASIDDELGKQFDRIRRSRNTSEYGIAHFQQADVDRAIETGEALLAAGAR